MTELRQIDNQSFLQELRNRIINNQLKEAEVLTTLTRKELITNCEIALVDNLTEEDWKKAFAKLENDRNYQLEVELWDNVNND